MRGGVNQSFPAVHPCVSMTIRFQNRDGRYVVLTADGVVRPIEAVLGRSFSEAEFSAAATASMRALLTESSGHTMPPSLLTGDASLLAAQSAPLTLYYLRKGLMYEAMAAALLDTMHPAAVVIDTADAAGMALWHVCRARGVAVTVATTQVPRSRWWRRAAWWVRECGYVARRWGRRCVQPADVLLVCNVGRQYDSLHPLVEQLHHTLRVAVVSKMPLPTAVRLHSPNVQYLDWGNLRTLRGVARMWQGVRRMRAAMRRHFPPAHWRNWLVHRWFSRMGQNAVRALVLAEHAVAQLQPRIVVVTDPSDGDAKSFTLVGRSRTIPSLCIQYGLVCDADSEWALCAQDHVAVFDAEIAVCIAGHGVPRDRIHITGNPRFDCYRDDPVARAAWRTRCGIAREAAVVAFMSVPAATGGVGQLESYLTIPEHAQLLQAVYAIPRADPHWVLVVKPHPEEPLAAHRHMVASQSGAHIRLVPHETAYQVLNAADVVITLHSTTGLEAIYLGKPLVTINLTGRPDNHSHAQRGAALGVTRAEDLVPTLQRLFVSDVAAQLAIGRAAFDRRPASSARECAVLIAEIAQIAHFSVCQERRSLRVASA